MKHFSCGITVVLVALLLAASPASAEENYRGELNSWGTTVLTQDNDFGAGNYHYVTITGASDDATSEFKFDSGGDWSTNWGTGSSYTNATQNTTIGQCHINRGGNSPGNLTINATNGNYYTFRIKGDNTWWYRPYVVMETSADPISMQSVTDNSGSAGTNDVTATIQISASKSAQERIWVRYTLDDWSSSELTAQASGSSTNYSATIPGQTNGSSVEYYVLTSTMPSNRIADEVDLCTLRGKKAGATNFYYNVGTPPADLGNCWHHPTNREPYTVTMRSPAEDPATNQDVYIYNGNQFQGAGNTGDQTGGALSYRLVGAGGWTTTNLSYDNQDGNNKYWKSKIPANTFGRTNVVEYYLKVTYNDHDDTYMGTTNNLASLTYGAETQAQANPFTFTYSDAEGSSAAWMWHNDNRVTYGSNVECWVKIGYAQGIGTNRYVDYAAIYYTTNGSDPQGAYGVGTNGITMVQAMSFDHMEGDDYEGGDAMWWAGTMTNLPGYTTIKYKIGSWKATNLVERFADYGTSGTNNAVFSFSLGTLGDPELTINGLNADYTTTKFFIDEIAGDSESLTVIFKPGVDDLEMVEIWSNIERRDYVDVDYSNEHYAADGIPDGIDPPDGNKTHTGDTGAYYRAYTMTQTGPGEYTWTGTVTQCGAYRLAARYSTNGMATNTWIWYSSDGRRDHAIVISPEKVHEMTMYELNALTVEATWNDEAGRSTFVDLLGAADGDSDGFDAFNLDYLNYIQANCLWFQPIHPTGIDRSDEFTPGSPYATRDYFAVSPYFGTSNTEDNAMQEFTNFVITCDSYTGSVGTINIMLDGVFNHTSWDAEFGEMGVTLDFCTNKDDRIGWFRPQWYSLSTDYGEQATYYNSAWDNDFATAPDRGDFGKWDDVCDFYFGKYSALVRHNPENNGDYLNEGDWYDYSDMNTNQIDIWTYFARYTEYWLEKTGHPGSNTWVQAEDDKGIDGLRCDFGQGLPPQMWEYIINRTRSIKWNFLFMAETLDGGIPGYRSNRHFDILNENLVFQFTQGHINDSWDVRNALENRRSSYNGGAILLNLTSHDEVLPDNDAWLVASRYGALGAVDGIPMLFYGQEKGIQNYNASDWYYDGFRTDHEENFGKYIPHFKQWNQLVVWSNPPPNATGLDQWYGRVNWARHNSAAVRNMNRYFLVTTDDDENSNIFAVAKYDVAGALTNGGEAVLCFANLLRHGESHALAADTYKLQPVWDLLGLNTGKLYNVRNLASSDASAFLWDPAKTGSELYNSGVYISLGAGTVNNITNDGELVQYLKIEEVNQAPALTVPGPHTLPVGSATNFTVTATDADGQDVTITNTVAPFGAGATGSVNSLDFGWTATAADVNTSNVVEFVGDDAQGQTNSVVTNTTYILVPWDWDTDGMSDGWEWNNFTTLVYTATDDNDSDGSDNYTESVAGTDPNLDSSIFLVSDIVNSAGGTNFEITITTESARHYTIEYTDSNLFQTVTWNDFANTNDGIGTWTETNEESSSFTFTDDYSAQTTGGEPANGHRAYRVKGQAP